MTAGQRSTTWNSPPLAPELFGLRWLRRESIRALSVQRVLANPSCLFAIAMPKRERPIAEWRSALSPPPRYPSSRRPRKKRHNDDHDSRRNRKSRAFYLLAAPALQLTPFAPPPEPPLPRR